MKALWQHVVDTGTALLFGSADANVTQSRTVHRVRQEYDTSCGVAVVAMFARVSHAEALAVIFPHARRRKTFYTNYKQVIRALDHFGIKRGPKQQRVRTWDEIPCTSLVAVKSTHVDGYWHWVIFQRRADGTAQVLDPDMQEGTQRLTPAEQAEYRPVSYLTVEPVPPNGARRPNAGSARLHIQRAAKPAMTDTLATMTVMQARTAKLAHQLSELTALSLGATRGRLSRAHGRTLLRNAFRDVWPTTDQAPRK